jgi:hypothetical protein
MAVRAEADAKRHGRDYNDCAECRTRRSSLLAAASTPMNAVDRIRRDGPTEAARVQDVA